MVLLSVAVSGFTNPFIQFQELVLEEQLLFYSPYVNLEIPEIMLEKEKTKVDNNIVEVLITKNGFEPEVVKVGINQKLTWKNERPKLTALVLGVREISAISSGFLEPGMEFTQKFSEPGEYTYVDGIIIGRVGKVIVQ
tara:strand:+ start:731 stop:1144 length:414 start_codon:yes stop_codon:yes gene_type:complete